VERGEFAAHKTQPIALDAAAIEAVCKRMCVLAHFVMHQTRAFVFGTASHIGRACLELLAGLTTLNRHDIEPPRAMHGAQRTRARFELERPANCAFVDVHAHGSKAITAQHSKSFDNAAVGIIVERWRRKWVSFGQ